MEKIITGRPQRNRRHRRRAWPPEDDLHQPRLVKRLFTPEIKRMLKDWLVRRRENPYPSRDEKKRLSIETGLTYTQICNWFANWRRKLKNSERERNQRSWGHLIKYYNTNARGNVEQFSISSDDSIWGEDELDHIDEDDSKLSDDANDDDDVDDDDEYDSREDDLTGSSERTILRPTRGYPNYAKSQPKMRCLMKNQLWYNRKSQLPYVFTANVSPTNSRSYNGTIESGQKQQLAIESKPIIDKEYSSTICNAKYKQKMMEKYLRDTNDDAHLNVAFTQPMELQNICNESYTQRHNDNTALTKWLESAARFTPDKNNYFIEWNDRNGKLERKQQLRRLTIKPTNSNFLQRQSMNSCPTQLELDAAEALANMAFNCRQRMLDCNPAGDSVQIIKAISS